MELTTRFSQLFAQAGFLEQLTLECTSATDKQYFKTLLVQQIGHTWSYFCATVGCVFALQVAILAILSSKCVTTHERVTSIHPRIKGDLFVSFYTAVDAPFDNAYLRQLTVQSFIKSEGLTVLAYNVADEQCHGILKHRKFHHCQNDGVFNGVTVFELYAILRVTLDSRMQKANGPRPAKLHMLNCKIDSPKNFEVVQNDSADWLTSISRFGLLSYGHK
ncbi:uncharacterized protein DEA37_0009756 [Paragonimus westermani]|uniref:Uncharacterized protein n=1 Tax=Paragonimus westermani TaxID=34504 RepID=A0A5J4NR96_9TREM|nr:uncharacterized protein DEA37_0009756 [Paragonimus westermani]